MKRRKDTEYVDTYQRYVTVPNMVVAPADHEQAMAEKDREIQQIREHEFQRGYQEAEEKYQQILEKSVKLAEAFEIIANDNGLTCIEVQQFLNSPEVQAWKERQP